MPHYLKGKGRTGNVPRSIRRSLKRNIAESIRAERKLFPTLEREIVQRARENNPDANTLHRAVEHLLEFEGNTLGGIRNADVLFKHPQARKSTHLGRISWDADGMRSGINHEQIIWPISKLLGVRPSAELRRDGYLPGFEPSAEEINRKFQRDSEGH